MHEWGLSLVGLHEEEIRALAENYPELNFELSYNMRPDQLETMAPILEHRVVSLHATCPRSRYFPNFASDNPCILTQGMDDIRRSIVTAKRYHASIMVLHPGYLCEEGMPSDKSARLSLLSKPLFQEHVAVREGSICDRKYPESDAYRKAMDRLTSHIGMVCRLCWNEGISLAIENLNPRSGYLCMTPDDFAQLATVDHMCFCLDIGHLWVSHFAFGFDFLEAVRGMLATRKVVSCHVHANPSDGHIWEDSHGDLDVNAAFPLQEALGAIVAEPVNCILETLSHPEHNIRIFQRFVQAS